MQSPVLAVVEMSVRFSVRLCVARWYRVKMTQAWIRKSSSAASPETLVLAV